MLIEAYTHKDTKKMAKVGEALFAIYPRTETPKANLNVKKGEDFYKYASVLTLLRPSTRASTSMHCGRLSYSVAFREHISLIRQESSDEESVMTKPATVIQSPMPLTPIPVIQPLPPSPPIVSNKPSSPIQSLTIPEPYSPPPKLSPNTIGRRTSLMNSRITDLHSDRTRELTFTTHSSTVTNFHNQPPEDPPIQVTPELEKDDTFHISIASTPTPDNTDKETTMDVPATSGGINNNRPPSKQSLHGYANSLTPANPRQISSVSTNSHVPKPNFEEIYVIMHGATSLPSQSNGSDPVPFATVKSLFEEEGQRAAQCATHASVSPTHSPAWEEVLSLQIPEERVNEEELVMTVSDSMSKEKLVSYRFPITYLIPFHTYHFELVQPTKSIPSGIRLYVTVQRRLSHLPRLQGFGFCGLEVTLRDFQNELSNPIGPLFAIGRLVPDYANYKDQMLSRRLAGITTTTLTFPSPNPSAFQVQKDNYQGIPQITTSSREDSKPQWNHVFLFSSEDAATMFSHNSALVIEFYATSTSMTSVTWTIRNPIGFCSLLLNDEVFKVLTSDAGRMGVRVDDLMVQASNFRTVDGPYPSVRLILRLITNERPNSMVVTSNTDVLPSMDSIQNGVSATARRPVDVTADVADLYLKEVEQPPKPDREISAVGGPPIERKKTRVLVKEDEYPPSDLLQNILPEYALTENDNLGQGNERKNSNMKSPNENNEATNNQTKSLLDHQARELNKYREAVKRMSADIVALRANLTQLQDENSRLRRELLLNKEVGQTVMDDINKGVISSVEVADKFVAVRQKLAKESDDLKKYKTKVHSLQNQMIKANEREKQYLTENTSKKDLENTIHNMEEKTKKMRKLEDTCLQQEKVIQKMEKLLSKYMKQSNRPHVEELTGDNDQQNAVTLLTQENVKLQNDFENLKATQQQHDIEKMDLKARLERAESRVVSLESQLDHNARAWGKEKHELTVRLQEHRNGIIRTTGAGLNSDPLM